MPENDYTYAEAAQRLRIAEVTLRAWVASGKVPCHRLGGRLVRFTDEDLEAAFIPSPALPRGSRRRGSRR
ncbi:MAG TPA: helix-turn-helix domain-containing protein [Catenuloplanes sp.]